MKPLAVVIPSKTARNLAASVAALRTSAPDASVIVIDDFDPVLDRAQAAAIGLDLWTDTVLTGRDPFIFARNVNLGIVAAGDSDVFVLNDDAILLTPGGFTAMQRAAEEHPEYGIISATTNVAGNPDQHPRAGGWLRDAGAKSVAFVCVLIPRRTIERIGLLDERFTAYGWEDNDYCRRVREAGLKVGIFDGCYVDHGSLTSTFRGGPHAAGDIHAGAEIYRAKWGDLA